MRAPSRADLLDEIRRLKAENERLTRLVKTQRPELEQLRSIEVALRDYLLNGAESLKRLHGHVKTLLPSDDADLPSMMELFGILSNSKERVDHALQREPDGTR
jgi:hypothetical protein